MLRKINRIHPRVFLTYVVISLVIPVIRMVIADHGKLQVFTNTLTIIGLVLIIAGLFYGMDTRGEYDLHGWSRWTIYLRKNKDGTQRVQEFKDAMTERKNAYFNYPLFLGVLYLIVSGVIAFGLL